MINQRTKSAASQYFLAQKALEAKEVAHQRNLDALDSALEQREADKVPGLRRKCAESEDELSLALSVAHGAWLAYWKIELDALIPDLRSLARSMRRFDEIRSIMGITSCRASSLMEAMEIPKEGVISADGIPSEAPDSDLLGDYRGCWR